MHWMLLCHHPRVFFAFFGVWVGGGSRTLVLGFEYRQNSIHGLLPDFRYRLTVRNLGFFHAYFNIQIYSTKYDQ